ncbi:MAG: hypothetical protein V4510_06680 [bacterium]
MGWLGLTVKIALGVVGVLGLVAGVAYASDFGIEATVSEVQCAGGGNPNFPQLFATTDSSATVTTRLFGLRHSVDLSRQVCLALRPDNFVVYHIRTGHTIVYQDSSKAHCIYDSDTGVCP